MRRSNRPIAIYGLIDPFSDQVVYVGQTVNPDQRLIQHIKEAIESTRPSLKHRWIKFLISRDESPTLQIFEWTDATNADDRELHWIKLLDSQLGITNIRHASKTGLRQNRFAYLDMIESIDPQIDEINDQDDTDDSEVEITVPPMSELKRWNIDELTTLRNQLERVALRLLRQRWTNTRNNINLQLETVAGELSAAETELELWRAGRLKPQE